MKAVRCERCGGVVAVQIGRPEPRCLFCGSLAVPPIELPEGIEPPEQILPFTVGSKAAREAFEDFASRSIWSPSDLASAETELSAVYLPAWAWAGRIETHWTGLADAGSRSGFEPTSGTEIVRFQQVLVPASESLTPAELHALGRFDESALITYDPLASDVPAEISAKTRSAARAHALREMERRHAIGLAARNDVIKVRTASIALELAGRPVLLPVFVGTYAWGDKVYRFLVHGRSGRVTGESPVSTVKIVLAGSAVASVLLLLLAVASISAWVFS